ncbi:MAG: hypothetical protein JRI23_30560 [Deltaproteobacteria bacterium]|nr:hypothetical protein [Deltaproteobacteria bacterium]MBW2536528.1 hypothetical protein [Deltaproteobacteria bacterium]
MVKQTAVWVSACSMLGALCGCGSTDDNAPPEISGLSSSHENGVAQLATALLTVEATDPDGDELEFSWEATLGAVAPGADSGTAVLTAPADRGTTTVTVKVSDGNGGEATEAIDIGVLGWAVPASAGNVASTISFNAVAFAGPDDGIAVGGDHENNVPTIYRYSNGVWTDETAGTAGHMTAAVAVSPTDMWTGGGGGLAFHFDGNEWTQFTIPGGCIHGMDAITPTDIWVTPAEGQPYMRRYTGGMVNEWEQFTAPMTQGMNGVSMAGETDGWAVGNGGIALRFNGTDWQRVETGTTAALKDVFMISPEDGWLVGGTGTLLHWDGAAWTAYESPSAAGLNGVFALATDDVWVVGDAGTILHFDGVAWTQLPSPIQSDLTTVHFTSPSDGWIGGFDSALLHLE